MQEELITFKTAKLAKEKGFYSGTHGIWDWENDESAEPYEMVSQSLLQKWLREVHNFHITICNTNPGNKVDFKFSMGELYKSDNDDSRKYIVLGSKGSFKTYEEALETGLQEALKLIKI